MQQSEQLHAQTAQLHSLHVELLAQAEAQSVAQAAREVAERRHEQKVAEQELEFQNWRKQLEEAAEKLNAKASSLAAASPVVVPIGVQGIQSVQVPKAGVVHFLLSPKAVPHTLPFELPPVPPPPKTHIPKHLPHQKQMIFGRF